MPSFEELEQKAIDALAAELAEHDDAQIMKEILEAKPKEKINIPLYVPAPPENPDKGPTPADLTATEINALYNQIDENIQQQTKPLFSDEWKDVKFYGAPVAPVAKSEFTQAHYDAYIKKMLAMSPNPYKKFGHPEQNPGYGLPYAYPSFKFSEVVTEAMLGANMNVPEIWKAIIEGLVKKAHKHAQKMQRNYQPKDILVHHIPVSQTRKITLVCEWL